MNKVSYIEDDADGIDILYTGQPEDEEEQEEQYNNLFVILVEPIHVLDLELVLCPSLTLDLY